MKCKYSVLMKHTCFSIYNVFNMHIFTYPVYRWHSWKWGWDSMGSFTLFKSSDRPNSLGRLILEVTQVTCVTLYDFSFLLFRNQKEWGYVSLRHHHYHVALTSWMTWALDINAKMLMKYSLESGSILKELCCYNRIELIHRVKYDSVLGNLS